LGFETFRMLALNPHIFINIDIVDPRVYTTAIIELTGSGDASNTEDTMEASESDLSSDISEGKTL